MDLLYRVLIEVSIEGIRKLSPAEEIDMQISLARERLILLYRMLPETIDSLLGLFENNTLYEYLGIYSLLGELNIYSDHFVPPFYLSSRAAFLQNAKWYRRFYCRSFNVDLDLALISGIPGIYRPALEKADQPFYVKDWTIIDWTPELIDCYRSLLADNVSNARLAGYLRLSRGDYAYEYDVGAFTDGEKLIRKFSGKLDRSWIARIVISIGYFSPTVLSLISPLEAQGMAARYVQPGILEELSSYPNADQFTLWHPNTTPEITSDFIRRVEKMIPVILAKYPEQVSYLTELKVVCGLPVDLEEIDRFPNSERIKIEMKMVAHPQCPLFNTPRLSRDSMVCYDPVGYVNLNGLDSLRNLQFLYITGRLLRVLPKRIQEVISHFQQDMGRISDTMKENPTL